jgi:hypothetical protein
MRKIVLVLLCLATPALAADTYNQGVGYITEDGSVRVTLDPRQTFACSLTGLAATLTQCQALTAGRTYHITDIVVQTTTTTAGTYAIRSGAGTNCADATAQVFPRSGTGADRNTAPISSQPTAVISPTVQLEVTAGHAICVIGAATNTINITILGFYTP